GAGTGRAGHAARCGLSGSACGSAGMSLSSALRARDAALPDRSAPADPNCGHHGRMSSLRRSISSEGLRMPAATSQGSRSGAIGRARAYVESGAFERDLARRVAHKTESQKLPQTLPELHRYLDEEMVPAFRSMGFKTHVYDNPLAGQGPVLL